MQWYSSSDSLLLIDQVWHLVMCFLTSFGAKNPFPQISQCCGILSVWVHLCLLRLADWVNATPHTSHLYGLLPVCIRMWLVKWPFSVNAAPQISHLKGFSPVCILTWVWRLPFCEKALPQWVHLNGFSSVWVLMCLNRLISRVNPFPHILQTWGLSPVWTIMCCSRKCLFLNGLPHTSHWCGYISMFISIGFSLREHVWRWFRSWVSVAQVRRQYGQLYRAWETIILCLSNKWTMSMSCVEYSALHPFCGQWKPWNSGKNK